ETENLPGPSTADKPEEQEQEQEIKALAHKSDQDTDLDAPTQTKGKAPAISHTIPQTALSAPPTAPKPVTLSTSAPKTSAPTTPAPQAQTATSMQGPSTSTQQPTQPQTASQPQQQSAPPPPPPPLARQITTTMAAVPAKAKWALPNQFMGKPNKISDLRGKEFISSLNLYFTHYDNDYGGAATTRTQGQQKERVLFALSLCTESAFPWADIYTSEFTVPVMDPEKEYIWDGLKSWETWSMQFNAHWRTADESKSATRAISKLKFKEDKGIVLFAGTFNDLASCIAWNDSAKQEILKGKLPQYLQQSMLQNTSHPTNYRDWLSWVIKLSKAHENFWADKPREPNNRGSSSRGSGSNHFRGRGYFGQTSNNRPFNQGGSQGNRFSGHQQNSNLDQAK
ncbi:hypothetical protein FRB95_004030, partial [Tulasnella sp. JGI-2019a]